MLEVPQLGLEQVQTSVKPGLEANTMVESTACMMDSNNGVRLKFLN